jgi:hypothetical protein
MRRPVCGRQKTRAGVSPPPPPMRIGMRLARIDTCRQCRAKAKKFAQIRAIGLVRREIGNRKSLFF